MSFRVPGHRADTFVGRTEELGRLAACFGRGDRLVTIVGAPGIGKTRLALEHLRAVSLGGAASLFCVCDASEARDDGELCAAVARALGAPIERRSGHDADVLADLLTVQGPLLLLLDNLEQISDAAAQRATEWLRRCPQLTLIATSRERLRIAGETGFELAPLRVPDEDALDELTPAVTLFIERARARDPEFTVTTENAVVVGRLARALDGIPLAIELAAARVGILDLTELATRLRSSLDVAARGFRTADPRHLTLRAAVDWSWKLLDDAERSVLAQCSVFRGGFSLAAAESILQGRGGGKQALDTLHSLRDKSMLRASLDQRGRIRFDSYVGIREFALERAAELLDVRLLSERHARYYVDAGVAWSTDVERHGARDAGTTLELERDNLLAAHEHLWNDGKCATDGLASALLALLALESVFVAHGPIDRLAQLLDGVFLRSDVDALDPELRARGLRARSKAFQFTGLVDAAEHDIELALTLLDVEQHPWTLACVLADSGTIHHQKRHVQIARARYEQALLLYERLGSKRQEARLLGNVGALHHDLRDFEMAEAYYLRALGLLRKLDEPRFEGNALANLGVLTHEQGLHDDAARYFERAETCLARAGDLRLLGIARGNWGVLEHERGQPRRALELLTSASERLSSYGDSASVGLCLARLGAVKAELEAMDESARDLERALRLVDADEHPFTHAAIELYDAFRRLRTEVTVSPDTLRLVRSRIQRAYRPSGNDGASAADLSDDVRSALRLVEKEVARAEPLGSLLDGIPDSVLVAGEDGTWFRAPFGVSRTLSRNGAVRRIFRAMVLAHQQARGALALSALRDAGWPGEKMALEAGTNRVHVALAELRRKGLKNCILRSEEGYALDPALSVRVVPESAVER